MLEKVFFLFNLEALSLSGVDESHSQLPPLTRGRDPQEEGEVRLACEGR